MGLISLSLKAVYSICFVRLSCGMIGLFLYCCHGLDKSSQAERKQQHKQMYLGRVAGIWHVNDAFENSSMQVSDIPSPKLANVN